MQLQVHDCQTKYNILCRQFNLSIKNNTGFIVHWVARILYYLKPELIDVHGWLYIIFINDFWSQRPSDFSMDENSIVDCYRFVDKYLVIIYITLIYIYIYNSVGLCVCVSSNFSDKFVQLLRERSTECSKN